MELGPFVQACIVGILAAGSATWAAAKVLSARLDRVELDVARLADAVEGPKGLQVRVARLEA